MDPGGLDGVKGGSGGRPGLHSCGTKREKGARLWKVNPSKTGAVFLQPEKRSIRATFQGAPYDMNHEIRIGSLGSLYLSWLIIIPKELGGLMPYIQQITMVLITAPFGFQHTCNILGQCISHISLFCLYHPSRLNKKQKSEATVKIIYEHQPSGSNDFHALEHLFLGTAFVQWKVQFGPGTPVIFLCVHLSVILTSPWKKNRRTYRTNRKGFYIPTYSEPCSVNAVFLAFWWTRRNPFFPSSRTLVDLVT